MDLLLLRCRAHLFSILRNSLCCRAIKFPHRRAAGFHANFCGGYLYKKSGALKNASMREKSYLDKTGYFAEERVDPHTFRPIERKLDFFGGLLWRFEQYVPQDQRKIDRIAIFKASKGLTISKNYTFNYQE